MLSLVCDEISKVDERNAAAQPTACLGFCIFCAVGRLPGTRSPLPAAWLSCCAANPAAWLACCAARPVSWLACCAARSAVRLACCAPRPAAWLACCTARPAAWLSLAVSQGPQVLRVSCYISQGEVTHQCTTLLPRLVCVRNQNNQGELAGRMDSFQNRIIPKVPSFTTLRI